MANSTGIYQKANGYGLLFGGIAQSGNWKLICQFIHAMQFTSSSLNGRLAAPLHVILYTRIFLYSKLIVHPCM